MIFDRFTGVKPNVVGEGTHFLIPWVQRPIIFGIRAMPRNLPVVTGSKGPPAPRRAAPPRSPLMAPCSRVSDLQNVHITLRILFRPIPEVLPKIYTNVGVDYADRVLPSITNEVLKAVVVRTLSFSVTLAARAEFGSLSFILQGFRHTFVRYS